MSNTISTLDLEHYCLFTTIEDEKQDKRSHSKRREHMKSIIFKLKDFKNFITIGPSWKTTQDGNDNISLWFCHPGDPILMQMQKPGVKLELVEVTDSNINDDILGGKFIKTAISGSKEEAGLKDNKESCESPLKSKTALKRENLPHSVAGTRNSPLKVSYLTPDNGSTVAKTYRNNTTRKLFVEEQSQSTNYEQDKRFRQASSVHMNMNREQSFDIGTTHEVSCPRNESNSLKRSVADICNETEDPTQQSTFAKGQTPL